MSSSQHPAVAASSPVDGDVSAGAAPTHDAPRRKATRPATHAWQSGAGPLQEYACRRGAGAGCPREKRHDWAHSQCGGRSSGGSEVRAELPPTSLSRLQIGAMPGTHLPQAPFPRKGPDPVLGLTC